MVFFLDDDYFVIFLCSGKMFEDIYTAYAIKENFNFRVSNIIKFILRKC